MGLAIKPKNLKWHIVRLTVLALCAAVFAMGAFAVTHRQSAAMAMALSAAAAAVIGFWPRLRTLLADIRLHRAERIATNTIAVLALAAALYAIVISGLMLGALGGAPADGATLIVLGCRVHGEEPSLMLYRRMDAALKTLRDKPEAVAILSGGQDPGEWITEAEAMRRYLTANGVAEERLFTEGRSTSTYENIMFSKMIIEDYGLSKNIAIATDGFHQFRAQSFAKSAGLMPVAVSSGTPVFTLPYYWLREIAAITVQVVMA